VLRHARRAAFVIAAALILAAAATVLTRHPGDPALFPAKAGDATVTVYVTAYGYHSGLVLPVARLNAAAEKIAHGEVIAIADRFRAYGFVEVGWGDAGFYRLVPTLSDLTMSEATRALFHSGNPSVLHVAGVSRLPPGQVGGVEIVPINLSEPGFERLVARLAESVATEDARPVELGPGLHGPSLFYRARGTFNIFNVCNHWVARLLNAAGVGSLPVLDTLPAGLLLDLRYQSDLMATGTGPG